MAMGLSFTALTLVAGHSMISDWVKVKDWAAFTYYDNCPMDFNDCINLIKYNSDTFRA